MPKFEVQWKADLEGITNLKPASKADYDWRFKFQCTKCNEKGDNWVVFTASDESEQTGSRGTANLVMKCKFCKAEGSANLEIDTLRALDIEQTGKFTPLVRLEARGLEPVEWAPSEGFSAEGAESGTKFEDIDLSEGDWTEYDEKQNASVEIMELASQIKKLK
ncbi:hypothetical protein HK097_003404 [Rhizophlyctis rosea]|uniref:DUF866-domain-containing protein n=1 Tax=Rhizophlyctis rosea TaxID=64517 RepID=A0AAD5SMN3_9FUNG|nr:hypothetical protein HK097_003404 [Rhizophlyctis rosea]